MFFQQRSEAGRRAACGATRAGKMASGTLPGKERRMGLGNRQRSEVGRRAARGARHARQTGPGEEWHTGLGE